MCASIRIALSLFVAALTTNLAAGTVLPPDATEQILRLRGRAGSGEQLAARDDDRSFIREIALRNERGELLTTAWVRRPMALQAGYRVVITYAGANTGDAMLQLIPAKDDLVVVAVQYPWMPPHTLIRRLRGVHDIRQAAYRTVAGGMVAVDFISQHEALDTNRILLVGASLGTVFATIHGAIDVRVPQVVLIHGGAGLAAMLDAEIRRVPAWLRGPLVRVARAPLATFDPARYVARIAPRCLLIIAARNDWRFPQDAVTAFFDRAGEPKEIRWTNTGHVGARNQRVVEIVIAELNAYLDRR